MRRKDKEIIDCHLIERILTEAHIIRLAMVDEDEPYLVAMNYAYIDGHLYMHSAKEGKKIEILKKSNKVAFQTEIGVELVLNEENCSCGTRYLSVFGRGKAFFIDENQEKKQALDAIMTKYARKVAFEYPAEVFDRTLVIKVEIEFMTGKKSGY
jgi:nitroimidazol reductase NimA-like FMN-containing flavoprotein (pyridoxamine 5'-phosphate oxidase superfamily)